MGLLPIVERELRAAAHHSRTWWQRVLILTGGLLVFGFTFMTLHRWANSSMIGRHTFQVLSGFGLVYALLSGPLATTDCLARERREGTLGLLFLTDLRSYDVVFGKLAAASLDLVLALASALPLVALPFLLGGVSLAQFAYTVLALSQIMFLSLAVGLCASSVFASGRLALGATVVFLGFLTLGVPVIGEEVLGQRFNSNRAAMFYMFCPLYTMRLTLDGFTARSAGAFWLNLAGLHGLAWGCLLLACHRTRHIWRDLQASATGGTWQRLFDHWRQGSASVRDVWRLRMLNRNPIGWIEGRDRLEPKVLWGLFLTSTVIWIAGWLIEPRHWADDDVIVPWALFAQYILCIWIAIQAPRRLADDKLSGALELLLCTPLRTGEIIRGNLLHWRRRFGWVLLASLGLDVLMLCLYLDRRGATRPALDEDLVQIGLCALAVFPFQAYSLARIGLYQGLVAGNSLRATFWLIGKAGLLPWVLFVGFMISWEMCRDLGLRFLPPISDTLAFGAWTGAHFLLCSIFLTHANWNLNHRFRTLAARTARPPRWKFWSRAAL